MERTITAAEYDERQCRYEEAYEKGLTAQPCTACARPVVEKHACWEFYPGSGTVLHRWCVGWWLMVVEASTWYELFLQELTKDYFDIHGWSCYFHPERFQPYRALMEKNRREHPGDSFFDRPNDPPHHDYYMDMAQLAMGVPIMDRGFAC